MNYEVGQEVEYRHVLSPWLKGKIQSIYFTDSAKPKSYNVLDAISGTLYLFYPDQIRPLQEGDSK